MDLGPGTCSGTKTFTGDSSSPGVNPLASSRQNICVWSPWVGLGRGWADLAAQAHPTALPMILQAGSTH